MALIRYKPNLELEPFGFHNMGATCYFNSLIQGLLSCTSFMESVQKYNGRHAICSQICSIIESKMPQSNPQLWILMHRKLAQMGIHFDSGQQCASEGFYMLLNTMEKCKSIERLFTHRTSETIYCPICEEWGTPHEELGTAFNIQADLKNTQPDAERLKVFKPNDEESLNNFLFMNGGVVDTNHKCEKCQTKCEKYKLSSLVMVPEILFIVSKKYSPDGRRKLHYNTNFPFRLTFNGVEQNEKKIFTYEAVAQIEHSGSLSSGHYWAICRRAGGWFRINDGSFSPASFSPNENTYIVIYHIQ